MSQCLTEKIQACSIVYFETLIIVVWVYGMGLLLNLVNLCMCVCIPNIHTLIRISVLVWAEKCLKNWSEKIGIILALLCIEHFVNKLTSLVRLNVFRMLSVLGYHSRKRIWTLTKANFDFCAIMDIVAENC